MKRPTGHVPHLAGLVELERLADDTVDLAEQIKQTVVDLRRMDESRGGDDEPAE